MFGYYKYFTYTCEVLIVTKIYIYMIIDSKLEVCKYLGIPDIPKKLWNEKSSFDKGVCLLKCVDNSEIFGICSYNEEKGLRVIKVFNSIPFTKIISVYPIPSYMDDDIEQMEFDSDESTEAMEQLLKEKEEIVKKDVEKPKIEDYEWGFPFIVNKEQAMAYLKEQYKKDKIKGAIPTKDEVLKAKLKVLYAKQQKLI